MMPPAPTSIEKMTLFGKLSLVLRGPDGRIKAVRHIHNHKVIGTFNIMASAICGSASLSAVNLGLGSGPDVVSTDTALSGEVLSRTVGRYSHDANNPNWNLSFSFTDSPDTVSIGQAGILTSLTGGTLFLKATFARITKQSQDLLNISWLSSIASV